MEHGEKFNTYTHLAGALFALIGAVVLVVMGIFSGDAWKVVSFSIYGATLVLLYSFPRCTTTLHMAGLSLLCRRWITSPSTY